MVCINHFLESDIKSNTMKKGAIPQIFNTTATTANTATTAHDGVASFITDEIAEIENDQYSLKTPEIYEQANNNIQIYRLEDKIKSLQAINQKLTMSMAITKDKNKQLDKIVRDSQKLLEVEQQQYELHKAAMKDIVEVRNL